MYGEMMEYYGLTKDLDKADYFETEAFKQTLLSLETAIFSGGIIALTGIVGIGKTTVLRQIQQSLKDSNKVIVSKSLATDKRRVNINTLYTALFSDLPTGKDFKIPTQPEKRERKLQELIRKINKPITLFIDEAHDLHWRTLIGLKHLGACPRTNIKVSRIQYIVLRNDKNNYILITDTQYAYSRTGS